MVVLYAKLLQVHLLSTGGKLIAPLLVQIGKFFCKFQHLQFNPFMIWDITLFKIGFHLSIAQNVGITEHKFLCISL